jgi:hypothetical protein
VNPPSQSARQALSANPSRRVRRRPSAQRQAEEADAYHNPVSRFGDAGDAQIEKVGRNGHAACDAICCWPQGDRPQLVSVEIEPELAIPAPTKASEAVPGPPPLPCHWRR